MASSNVRRVLAGGLALLAVGATMAGGAWAMFAREGVALAAPEPDPVPRRWQLTLEPGPLRITSLNVEGVGPRLYYYMTYKVTNTSGQDQMFTPAFELANDMGDVQRGGRDVPAPVTKAVLDMLENPLLEDQISIVGMILQGQENAKEGLVIWPVTNNHVHQLEVYGAGFSGETRTLDTFDPDTKGTKRVTLRKSLMVRYQPMGEVRQGNEPYPVLESRWILR